MLNWRTRLHSLTHSAAFLWKLCGAILVAALLLAALMLGFRDRAAGDGLLPAGSGSEDLLDDVMQRLAEFEHPAKPNPVELANLLRMLKTGANPDQFDPVELRFGSVKLQPILHKHLESDAQREVFADFVRCRLLDENPMRMEAMQRLHDAAAQTQPVRFANEFEGDLLAGMGRRSESLKAYLREGLFADAHRARSLAFSTALVLQDKATLRNLSSDPIFGMDMDAFTSFQVASLLDDRWMLLRAIGRLQWHRWTHSDGIPLALLSAAVWYVILVYSASRERHRWLRYLPPVLAGVWSVWLLHWWQGSLHYGLSDEQQVTPTHELVQWIVYVGLPEETVKLCLFAPFLPFLLRCGSSSKAALTAGCVGLGFALDENLGYFIREGETVAVGRFVTANFMHVAFTGIAGGWLYELVRSRFHAATEFLTAFLGVVAAHGVYDFSSTDSAQKWGVEIVGIVILAFAARFYLDRLRTDDVVLRRRTVSSTSVFCVGCALLTGATILLAVDNAGSMKGAVDALRKTVAIIPVALIYVREFREL
ncbi:MAG: PrsW family glutamic-type intramembrane protease [Verrucomicrobiaceae bacterium]